MRWFRVYVGVSIFALCGPVGVLVGFKAARFLAATGVRLLIAVRAARSSTHTRGLLALLWGPT